MSGAARYPYRRGIGNGGGVGEREFVGTPEVGIRPVGANKKEKRIGKQGRWL